MIFEQVDINHGASFASTELYKYLHIAFTLQGRGGCLQRGDGVAYIHKIRKEIFVLQNTVVRGIRERMCIFVGIGASSMRPLQNYSRFVTHIPLFVYIACFDDYRCAAMVTNNLENVELEAAVLDPDISARGFVLTCSATIRGEGVEMELGVGDKMYDVSAGPSVAYTWV